MLKDVAKSTEILFDLVSTLEPRLAPLEDWFYDLCQTIDKWYQSEGTQGIKRAKDSLAQGWLSILGEETEQLDYVKTVNGIPQLVLPLVNRVRPMLGSNGVRLLSATLSLIRVTDLWLGIPTDYTVGKQVEVIQNSTLPESAHEIISEFSEFIEDFMAAYPDHPVVRAYRESLILKDDYRYLYRESKGPNGSLTANAHKDVKTLMEAKTSTGSSLLDSIVDLQWAIINDSSASGWTVNTQFPELVRESDCYDDMKVSSCPGKLNFIAEKSGKVRIVAQPDYFSQTTLRPLHDWTFNVLRHFPADCTFDQRSAVPKIQQWQLAGKYVASFDQSSCTDLFPFDLQLRLLSHRFGEALTESVKTVMSDREWELRLPSKTTKKVRWSVGQPMGMLLSWPLMALTHHFLVQYAYWVSSGRSFSKKGPFNDYVICGDDIVIASKSVADSYRKIVKSLGMKINVTKSHISGGGTNIPPISEFAKITIWKGHPLYTVRPNMILSAVRDWRNAVPLLIDLANVDGFNMKLKAIERWVKRSFPQGKKFLIPLLTIPRELGGVGYRDSVSMKRKFELIHTGQVHPYIVFLAMKVRAGLLLETRELRHEELDSVVTEAFYRCHPLTEYSKDTINRKRWMNESLYTDESLVPTVREIIKDILTDGIEPYTRFIFTDSPSEVLPHWIDRREQDMKRSRTLWEKSLSRDFILPQVVLTREYGYARPDLKGLALLSFAQKTFTDRQFDVVSSILQRCVDQSR